MFEWNNTLFAALNAPADISPAAIAWVRFFADDLIYSLPLLMLYSWLRTNSEQRAIVVLACMAAMCALLLNYSIGLLWFSPRPYALGVGQFYLTQNPESSFPSDHMSFAWSIAITFLLASATRQIGYFMIIIALVIGFSRIYAGIHFPLDILGSMALSTLLVLGISSLSEQVKNTFLPPLEQFYRQICAPLITLGWVKP